MDLSVETLLPSLLIGSIGFGLFLFGKKELRGPQFCVGLALMIYPYFVAGALAMWGIGGVLLLGLWLALRAGL